MTTPLNAATRDEHADVCRTMLRQIGNLTLRTLRASMVTYEGMPNGDTAVRFLIGNPNALKLRKIEVTYRAGRDDYEVRSFICGLRMGDHGTELANDERYSTDGHGVYAEQLASVVIAAARAAGARPRI